MRQFYFLIKTTLLFSCFFSVIEKGFAVVRYVKPGSAGTAPYTSWATASNDLQAVINAASAGDEIWIATGTYLPNRRADAVTVITANNRNNAFVLKNNVKIYGGFKGIETSFAERDLAINDVILSGDIGTVNVTTDNCFHVVISAGLAGANTLLDGVIITKGYANANIITPSISVNGQTVSPRNGGGLYKTSSVTDFTDCSILENYAIVNGGGIYELTATSTSRYLRCDISRNDAGSDGGGMLLNNSGSELDSCIINLNECGSDGGGICITGNGSPLIKNGRITNCDASGNGGGLASFTFGTLSLRAMRITANESVSSGGGIYTNNSPVNIINCLITGNATAGGGAGIWNSLSDVTITNTTIAGNKANSQAGGIGNGLSNPTIQNCIIYGNTGVPASTNSIYNSGSTPIINNTLIQGGFAGSNNVNADPLFVSPLSAALAPTSGGNYQIQKCSPALNGGDNSYIPVGITVDLLSNPRIHYGIADMGAYELPLILAVPDANGIVYVDYTKTGNGSSWGNAVAELSDALVAAKFNTTIEQVWVAKGNYYPKYSKFYRNLDCNLTNRFNAFVMVDNLKLYGGFAGGETDTSNRNFVLNATILDGNINAPGLNNDNCYTVVVNYGTLGTTELNGFSITNAFGTGPGGMENVNVNSIISNCRFYTNNTALHGAAMVVINSNTTIQYCSFTGNTALQNAGAIYTGAGTLIINGCEFSNNSANADGGAIYNSTGSVLTVKNSRFQSNTAVTEGGGISTVASSTLNLYRSDFIGNSSINGGGVHILEGSNPCTIINCSFRGNSVVNLGGGICCHRENELRNCLFSGNYSAFQGGAIHFASGINYQVNNCTIAANKSVNAGSAILVTSGILNIRNSVIDINNGPFTIGAPTVNATYSLIQGGMVGTGNIVTPAVFMNGIPGLAAPFSFGDYRLQKCSPGINAGDNSLVPSGLTHELDSNIRIAFGTVDMGAFEKHLAKPDTNGIVYVDSSNNILPGDGSSWTTAIAELADAIKEAGNNTDIKEIWVAKGTYKPVYNASDALKNSICHSQSRDDAFVWPVDVKIFGGFAGGETDTSGRNYMLNETILSGDIGVVNDSTDNNYHVNISAGNAGTGLIDGFTIAKGQADGTGSLTVNSLNISKSDGGALYCNASSPSIKNCRFINNTATNAGAVYNTASSPDISNCTFQYNVAALAGGAMRNVSSSATKVSNSFFSFNSTLNPGSNGGGAIENNQAGNVLISNSTFSFNNSKYAGGAILDLNSNALISDCIITNNVARNGAGIQMNNNTNTIVNKCSIENNTATNTGGGVFISSGKINQSSIRGNTAITGAGIYTAISSPMISNSLISGNAATASGGGVYCSSNSSLALYNCSISGNTAINGGGVHLAGPGNIPSVYNSIIWNNNATVYPGIYSASSGTVVSHSLIQGGFTGTANFDLDPAFVAPQLPAAAPTILGDYRLQACSPAINLGNNTNIPPGITEDLDNLERIRYSTVDAGAFEIQTIDLSNSVWKGINTNWNDKLNWCGGYIPADTTNVSIPVTPNNPSISTGFNNAVKNISFGNNTSITLAANSRLEINGTYTNNGSVITNNGNWVMKGNAPAQVFPGIQGSITAMHNLEIDNPSGITLNKSFGITGKLTARNGIITLNNDTVSLKSTVTATAMIDTVHSGAGFAYTGTGKFEIERFIPAQKAWRLLTAPVNAYQSIKADWQENQTNLTLTNSNLYPGYGTHISGPQSGSGFDYTNTNNPSMLQYNSVTNSLSGIPNSNVLTLNHQPGYFLFVHGSRAYDLTLNNLGVTDNTVLRSRGTIKTGSQPVSVAASGFTLVGNPYASAIDFDQLSKTNVGNKFTLWDPSRSGSYGYGGYVTFTKVGALYVAAPPPASASLNQLIQSGAAFFVEGSGTAGTLTFEETDKVAGSASDVFRNNNTIPSISINLVRIGNSGTQSYSDGTLAVFDESASNNLDTIDAGKKLNDNQNISLLRNGKLLAIEAHQPVLETDSLFIALNQLQQRNYILEITPQSIGRPGLQAILKDQFLNTSTELSLTDTSRITFTVTADTASAGTNRFIIVFTNNVAGPVPVRFVTLKSVCNNTGNEIRFVVSNEMNIRNYEIQHSSDGRHFSSIGSLMADGSTSAIKTYIYQDNQADPGFQYYRILSYDFLGAAQYSEIIRAADCGKMQEILVYPNPIENKMIRIHFVNEKPDQYKIGLFDAAGKMVLQQSILHNENSGIHKMNINRAIAAGQYLLKVYRKNNILKSIPITIQ